MVMNSPLAAPHVHHYSYPLDHDMLINIYKIQFIFFREQGRMGDIGERDVFWFDR